MKRWYLDTSAAMKLIKRESESTAMVTSLGSPDVIHGRSSSQIDRVAGLMHLRSESSDRGTRRATGTPRRVTSSTSPASTRRSTAPLSFLISR